MRAGMLALVLEVGLGGCAFSSTPYPASGGPADANGSGAPGDGESRPAPDASLPDAGRPIDAAIDAGPAQPGDVCLGRFGGICVAPPADPLTLGTQTIDTSSSALCVDYRPGAGAPPTDACVIAGSSIAIEGNTTVAVTGRRPLILFSTSTITIAGVLDVASHRASPTSKAGPGADAAQCSTTVTDPTVGASNNGGGGRGGTFGGTGGSGGSGAQAGQGGIAAPLGTQVLTLQGGCPGSAGAGTDAGVLGHGGGAVMLIAMQSIALRGTINASGAAGGGGKNSAGGGGGGSGGMIVLDAATVELAGPCFANGGGGGEGGDLSSTGNAGNESTMPAEVALGGDGANRGGKGGDGGAGARAAAAGLPGSLHMSSGHFDGLGGGGGGGGGIGVVKVFTTGANDPGAPASARGGTFSGRGTPLRATTMAAPR